MGAAGFRAPALALLCAACTSIHARQATFDGTEWRIVAVNGVPAPSYPNGWPFPVRFSRGFMSGTICNNFQGPYSVSGDFLQLGGMQSTERGCDGPTMKFEQSAFAIFNRRPMRMRWDSSRKLTLSNDAGSLNLELLR